MKCEYCNQEIQGDSYIVFLDGIKDFYELEVCEDCNEKLNDYYEPEVVDEMMKNNNCEMDILSEYIQRIIMKNRFTQEEVNKMVDKVCEREVK
jgi:ribosome-binding protein aMBF1 (putative translation factor)